MYGRMYACTYVCTDEHLRPALLDWLRRRVDLIITTSNVNRLSRSDVVCYNASPSEHHYDIAWTTEYGMCQRLQVYATPFTRCCYITYDNRTQNTRNVNSHIISDFCLVIYLIIVHVRCTARSNSISDFS